MSKLVPLWGAVVVLVLAAARAEIMAPSGSGSGTGPSDTSQPGPLLLAAANPTSAGTVDLGWNEPFDDTTGPNGTGTGVGGPVATRTLVYRSDHAIVADADFTTGTPILPNPALLTAGFANNTTVTGLTTGVTYWFAVKATDDAGLFTMSGTNGVLIPTPPGPPPPDAAEGGGGACTVTPTRGWFADWPGALAKRATEGFSIIVLIGFLAGIGLVLRRK